MTEAGWYDYTEAPGTLRWWDGTTWTDHRHPAPTAGADVGQPEALVHVTRGPGVRKELLVTADRLVIGTESFPLDEIDSVQWDAVRSHVNGAYMGTLYSIRVQVAGRKGDVALNPGSRDRNIDELAAAYQQVVRLLDAVVCPRIAHDLVARMQAGETVTLGPTGARVELTAAGFRLKKPLSKVVPWARVARTELQGGRFWFLLHRDGGEPKRHATVGLDGANIVVLPHLVRLLSPTSG
jgi:hypothetical protein